MGDNNVKKTNLFNQIKCFNSFSSDEIIEYFLQLDRDIQEFLIFYINETKNLENKENYIRILDIFENIKLKIINDIELNANEIKFFQRVYYIYEINEIETNDYLLNKFCKKYIRNENAIDIDRIFLISWDIINSLNSKYNKLYKIKFLYDEQIKIPAWVLTRFDCESSDNKNININIYVIDLMIQKLKTSDYEKSKVTILYLINSILHEYKHLMQNDYLIRNDDMISELYIRELFVKIKDNKKNKGELYKKYHENFYLEKEANIFAFNNMFLYFNQYFYHNEKFYKKSMSVYSNIFRESEKNSENFKRDFEHYYNLWKNDKYSDIDDYKQKINIIRNNYNSTKLTKKNKISE